MRNSLYCPVINITELYKIIGTSNREGTDRSPLMEMLDGSNHYATLTKNEPYFGLSVALLFSLILGDYSVHSGNVVALKNSKTSACTQFARIDLGASFRNFGHQKNH